jgi:branched-chain amino acid transport system substrate-binding protein
MQQVLKQCNGDSAWAGIKASTSHTDHRPIKAMQLERWDGKTWLLFGDIIEAGT